MHRLHCVWFQNNPGQVNICVCISYSGYSNAQTSRRGFMIQWLVILYTYSLVVSGIALLFKPWRKYSMPRFELNSFSTHNHWMHVLLYRCLYIEKVFIIIILIFVDGNVEIVSVTDALITLDLPSTNQIAEKNDARENVK